MSGKVLKVTSNDLYGNVDDRAVSIFACFEHSKYMNNYVIFAFDGEYDKNKLCYGSLHLKNNSLVIFSVKDDVKKYIDEFIVEYASDNLINFKILDIKDMDSVELVSYKEMDYNDLELLDKKSIVRVIDKEVVIEKKKPIYIYIILCFLILLAGGLTLLYFYPELFTSKYKGLECSNRIYDKEIELYYDIDKNILFNKKNRVDNIEVIRIYTFIDSNKYYDFKDNNRQYQYFTNGEKFKFIDESLQLKIIYNENSVIDEYEEMYVYMNREGYSCKEVEYER